MFKPTLDEAKAIDKKQRIIPVSTEIFSDGITPVTLLKKLKKVSGSCFILESAEDTKKWGRYTFLGFDPKMEITCINGVTTVKTDDKSETKSENPNLTIQRILDDYKSVRFDYLPPFTGGLVGYFAYDYVKYCESKSDLNAQDNENWNDVDLMLFHKIIAFDNLKQKIIIIVNISAENLETEYENAIKQLEYIKALIKSGEPQAAEPLEIKSEFRALFSKEEYCLMVNRAKDYIKEGDIFQAVLSNRFEADVNGSILDAYRILRTLNPSPYMFYFSGSTLEIAGASPETLVKLQDGKLHTFPLAGTRPRGAGEAEDAALEKALLADEKELAEHNMLVDLGRNDLGKISKPGSVRVDKYMDILRFSHVMHIGSEVSGEIVENFTGLDTVNAVLPAGTLSGAPKIRAMQIINELEKNKRGVYGGAIGYLDFTGNMDTCIAIRIAYKKGGKVFIRSGAGVVADSNPESEYQECLNKARAVQSALEQAAGGIE
ncbi:MAG: anthranilate synthase component I [Chitinispirillales bacterium]|jgi:anthranilate synthase component 1|nr:anthranilate synthase component I [Chitinispirillales bacterium]